MSDEGTTSTPAPPVETLNYSYMTNREGRPGILTAVGVMSIVVACLSALGSVGSSFSSITYYMMARMPAATFTAPMPMPTTAPTTAASGVSVITLPTYNATAWSVTSSPRGATTTTATTMPATAPTFTGNP